MRPFTLIASIACVVLTVLPHTAQAESPPCDYLVQASSITSDAPACVTVQVSGCYNALEGSLNNNCASTVLMKGWPNTGGDLSIEPGKFNIFALLTQPPPGDNPLMYDASHVVEIDGASFPVRITATIARATRTDTNTSDDGGGGCAVARPPTRPPRAPSLWIAALALGGAFVWRRRRA